MTIPAFYPIYSFPSGGNDMTRQEIIDLCGKAAREAQIRDDVCSRSTLIGLKAYFDWIGDDMIRASMNLCGGAGGSSGTCGTFTAGLLAVGLKYNVPLDEELKKPSCRRSTPVCSTSSG
jgi:hypothetical protein